jgi:hypothetical protein
MNIEPILMWELIGSRCCPYPPCERWRNTPRRSSRLWQHVSFGTHVRAHQNLAQVAPEDQPGTEVSNAVI